jgi:hypothetical protein
MRRDRRSAAISGLPALAPAQLRGFRTRALWDGWPRCVAVVSGGRQRPHIMIVAEMIADAGLR